MQFTWFDPFQFFGMFNIMFMVISAFIMIVVIVVFVSVCRVGAQAARGISVSVPTYAIPEQYRSPTRPGGTEIRTVRLPAQCPTCGATIAPEGIDWVGPLEAKCNYCGGTVRAQLERV